MTQQRFQSARGRFKLFSPKPNLTKQEVEYGLRTVVKDAMASQAMASLTGSAFLVAFALELGASNATIGLLAAIPHLTQLIQFPTIFLVERIRNRRLISVFASLVGRFSWLLIAVAPIFFVERAVLPILVAGLLGASLMAAVSNCGWNSWMHELIPTESLGTFFGHRFSMSTATGAAVSLAAGFFLDHYAEDLFPGQFFGYSVIFGLGFLMGLLGVYFISKIPEPQMAPTTEPIHAFVAKPFKDQNFLNLIRFLGSWHFAIYLATPFFTVYMLKRLELDLSLVIGLIVLGRVVNIVFLRWWGRLSDRLSNKAVLAVSGPLFLACILAWTFTTLPEKYAYTIPLLVVIHILMGVAMAGITLATGNIGLKLAPKGEATSYLAASSFVIAVAAGTAPLLSGSLIDLFVSRELSWTLRWSGPTESVALETLNLQQWDFLFVIAFLVGLYSIHRLSMVKEVGYVKEKLVIFELIYSLGREVRDFSSVSALRNVANMTGIGRRTKRNDGSDSVDD